MAIRRQHVISKVLLKRFANRSDDNPRLVGYNLEHGSAKHYPVTSVGYVEGFIPHGSEAAEAAWGSIETRVHPALEALEDPSTPLTDEHVDTLKQLIALHYIRRDVIKTLGEGIFGNLRTDRLNALSSEPRRLELLSMRHLGRPAETDEDVQEITRWLSERYDEWEPELFSGAMINAVRSASGELSNMHLQLWRASHSDFLISDQAVLTLDRNGLPVRTGGLARDFTHLLPVGRQTQIGLATCAQDVTLDAGQVDDLNRLHLRIADRFVYFHPDSELGPFCDSNRRILQPPTTTPDAG